MAGSPEEASSPEEERTTPEASRSSNASGSSSSSSSSDDEKPSEPTAGTLGELDGGSPHEKHAIEGASSVVAKGRQEEQHQHKVKGAQETGRLSLQGDLMSTLMVAGGVAVAVAIAVAAAFLANKKR